MSTATRTDSPCVYLISDDTGVIYIGKTTRLARRLQAHRSRDWWSDDLTVEARECVDEATMATLETELISKHRPRHNIVSKNPAPERTVNPPLAELLDARLGGLDSYVYVARVERGRSWRDVARDVSDLGGFVVTYETLRRWYRGQVA